MPVTSLNIATMNVRSLGQGVHGVRKRCELCDFLRNTSPQVDVILIQDHCFSYEDCFSLTQQLQFRGGVSYWNNALYSAIGDKFHAGTGISISPSLSNRITGRGAPVEGRAQFVTFNLSNTHIGILNIYASSDTGARARFWAMLLDYQFLEAEWILTGDFNMTEVQEDRSADFNARNMGRREQGAWHHFIMTMGLYDVFYSDEYRQIGDKRHTWRRQRPQPTWSRLDRFYTTNGLRTRGGCHGIWPHLSHISDHAPTFLQIPLSKRRRKPRPRFTRFHTGNPRALEAFTQSWKLAMTESGPESKGRRIETALEQIRKLSTFITQAQKAKNKATYRAQFEATASAEAALATNWDDLEAWSRLNEAQAELESIRLSKLEYSRNKLAARWCMVGDRCSKDFFEFHKSPSRKSDITELVDNGRVLHDTKEIGSFVHNFYHQLYRCDPEVEANTAGREECLRPVRRVISETQNLELIAPIMSAEVLRALKDVPPNKAPGHDSVPPELLLEL